MIDIRRAQLLALAIGFGLAALQLLHVNQHAVDFPLHDDYQDSLRFLLDYQDADGILPVVNLMREQHIEHRQLFSRMLYALHYELFGVLDYRQLLVAANCLVILTWLLLAVHFRQPLLTLLGALLLFSSAYWNSIYWLAAAGSNFSVMLFGIAALLLLQARSAWSFGAALACAGMGTFALGNGFLLWPLGFAQLLLQRAATPRLACWAGAALFAVGLYFFDYHDPGVLQLIPNETGKRHPWELVLAHPLHFGQWTLAVIGLGFSFGHEMMATGVGLGLLVALGWALSHREARHHPATLAIIAFLLSSLCLAAYGRFVAGFAGIEIPNRYAYYSLLLALAILGLLGATRFREQTLPGAVVALSLALALTFNWTSTDWGIERHRNRVAPLQKNLLGWLTGDQAKIFALFAGEQPGQLLGQAIDRSLWHPLQAVPEAHRARIVRSDPGCPADKREMHLPAGAYLIRLEQHRAGEPRAGEPRAGKPRAGKPRAGKPRTQRAALCVDGVLYRLQWQQVPAWFVPDRTAAGQAGSGPAAPAHF